MKRSDWDEMLAAKLGEEDGDATTTTQASTDTGEDSFVALDQSLSDESDVSDHELRAAAGFESSEDAEAADEEFSTVFG